MERRNKGAKPKNVSRSRPKLRRSKRTPKKTATIDYQWPMRTLSKSRRINKSFEKSKEILYQRSKLSPKQPIKSRKTDSPLIQSIQTKESLSECTKSEQERQSRMSALAKRREERELKRKRRELIEGKRVDQASFTVFNSIEGYFY